MNRYLVDGTDQYGNFQTVGDTAPLRAPWAVFDRNTQRWILVTRSHVRAFLSALWLNIRDAR
jgi:hypothetical protein